MIAHFGKFIYRMPYFSYREIDQPIRETKYEEVDRFLLPYLSRPEVQDAIFIASPDFSIELGLYLSGSLSRDKNRDRHEKFVFTALKYIIRMSSRPTPFGLFAGCGIGEVGASTYIEPASVPLKKSVRMDTGFMISIYESVLEVPEYRQYFTYFTNNTIYPVGEKCRYVEFFTDPKGMRIYNLSSFENNEYLNKVLAHAASGLSFKELYLLLVDDEIDEQEAAEFINELISSRILINELEPMVVGSEYDEQFLATLKKLLEKHQEQKSTATIELTELYNEINFCYLASKSLEEGNDGVMVGYNEITDRLNGLKSYFKVKSSLQIDSKIQTTSKASISEDLLKDILKGTQAFLRFSRVGRSGNLSNFITEFNRRYEGRVMSLTEVLDPEIGIGYNKVEAAMLDYSPLVDDVPMPARSSSRSLSINWDMDVHTFFFNKVLIAYKRDEYAINLTDTEIAAFPINTEMPATTNAFVTVVVDGNGKQLIKFSNIGGSSASNMLGRFSLIDEEIATFNSEIAIYEKEFYKGAIVAEINHLSDTRAGNISNREGVHAFEIPYITKSNSNQQGLIPVQDLYLYNKGNKLVLYSKSLDMEVVPRLSNAHNFNMNTLPVYKFLCDFQGEVEGGNFTMGLNLGHLPEFFEFLPRIQYNNFIYLSARWGFLHTEIMEMRARLSDKEIIPALVDYLRAKKIPNRFYLIQKGDNELLFDLESEISMRLFLYEASKIKKLKLKECILADFSHGLIENNSGSFFHELLVPLKNTGQRPNFSVSDPDKQLHNRLANQVKRKFIPGEEWTFIKVYAGIDTVDKIIANVFPTLIKNGEQSGKLGKWFFLRYGDPDFHLRIRIQKNDYPTDWIQELNGLLREYLESGLIPKIMLDTYERELERYGYDCIDAAESVFHADSGMITSIVALTASSADKNLRWKCGMKILDTYMDAFEMDLEHKYAYTKQTRDKFAIEFNANKMQKRKIINKFRDNKSEVDAFFQPPSTALNTEIEQVLNRFKLQINKYFHEGYNAKTNPDYYLESFIHMTIVRLVRSKNRITEYLLYSYLEQYYRFEIGKKKHLTVSEEKI